MIEWSIAAGEAEKESGVRFLLEHVEELGIPYSWATVMSTLIYPMEDNGLLIGKDPGGNMVSLLAFTMGTMEDKYADRSRIEVHLLFMERRLRHGRPLIQAIRMLADHLMELPSGAREVVFYAPVSEANRRLYGRIAALRHTSEQPCGPLDFYGTTPERLLAFADRYLPVSS